MIPPPPQIRPVHVDGLVAKADQLTRMSPWRPISSMVAEACRSHILRRLEGYRKRLRSEYMGLDLQQNETPTLHQQAPPLFLPPRTPRMVEIEEMLLTIANCMKRHGRKK